MLSAQTSNSSRSTTNMSKKKIHKQIHNRIHFSFGFVVLLAFVLIANLFYIQIRNGEYFKDRADNQYTNSTSNLFERGNIYFTTKNGEKTTAAGQKVGYKVSVNPSTLSIESVDKILEYIKVNDSDRYDYVEAQLNKNNRKYFELFKKLDKEQLDVLKDSLGSIVSVHTEKWRTYPLQEGAAHTLGFLAYKGDIYAGRYGLERFYDNYLKRSSKDLYTNFFARIFHNVQDLAKGETILEGDLVSSIDPRVQVMLDKEVSSIQRKWSSKETGAIIIDPKTGGIRALSASPGFNVNNFSSYSNANFRNPLVENVYEFGSIMKPLVVAMALDKDLINSDSQYYDKGSVQVEDYTINNFDKKGRGWISMQDVLNQSLNTGMVYITKKIQKQDFRDYFSSLGLRSASGVDLPNDSRGLSSNLDSNRLIEFTNISFGQGIAISPMSMVKALTALANSGKVSQPHVVNRIEYTNKFAKELFTDQQDLVFDKDSSDEITRMLVNVYDNYSDGKHSFDNYSVAAKTGTAQIASPGGAYYKDRNLHSFFGYFPAYEPEYLVYLYTVHPKNAKYSSQTLIDPFKNITNSLINYYNIAPDR